MSARQLIVLVVAAIAAIGALLIIRGMGARRAEPTAVASAPIAGEEVLVAARDLPSGAALTPGDMKVVIFPSEALSPAMVRSGAAQTELVGAVTRRAFAQGEPLTAGSVLQPDGHGFMAAQLEPGYRAVAMEIDQAQAAAGYIQPNDHVDVILTYSRRGGEEGGGTGSELVLSDVRVLALDDSVSTQASGDKPERINAAVALLEMTAADARAFALAEARGDLTLALRGVEAETVGMRRPAASALGEADSQHSGSVLVHAFGEVSDGGGR